MKTGKLSSRLLCAALSASIFLTGCGGGGGDLAIDGTDDLMVDERASIQNVQSSLQANLVSPVGGLTLTQHGSVCKATQKYVVMDPKAVDLVGVQIRDAEGSIGKLLESGYHSATYAALRPAVSAAKHLDGTISFDPASRTVEISVSGNNPCGGEAAGLQGSFWKWAVGIAAGAITRILVGSVWVAYFGLEAETIPAKVVAGCAGGAAAAIVMNIINGWPNVNQSIGQVVGACLLGSGMTYAGDIAAAMAPGFRYIALSIRAWLAPFGTLGERAATELAARATAAAVTPVGSPVGGGTSYPCYTCTTVGTTSTSGATGISVGSTTISPQYMPPPGTFPERPSGVSGGFPSGCHHCYAGGPPPRTTPIATP